MERLMTYSSGQVPSKGDKVVCVDTANTFGNLELGKGYIVKDVVFEMGIYLLSLENKGSMVFKPNRFELIRGNT